MGDRGDLEQGGAYTRLAGSGSAQDARAQAQAQAQAQARDRESFSSSLSSSPGRPASRASLTAQREATRALRRFEEQCDVGLSALTAPATSARQRDAGIARATTKVMKHVTETREKLQRMLEVAGETSSRADRKQLEKLHAQYLGRFEARFKDLNDRMQGFVQAQQQQQQSKQQQQQHVGKGGSGTGGRRGSARGSFGDVGANAGAQGAAATSGGSSDNPFADQTFDQGASAAGATGTGVSEEQLLQEAVSFKHQDIRTREREFTKIQTKVVQLNEAYREIGAMVESQGADVEQIAVQVEGARENTGAALEELHKTAMYRRTVNPYLCCFMLALLIAVAVLVALIATKSI